MRRRRKELGWTQARLAEESGVNLNALGCIERLLQPTANIRTANDYLLRIARALEVEFEVLFPAEYLALVERKLLPRRRSPYLWVSELSLDQLPENAQELLLPGPDVTVIEGQLDEAVREVVGELRPAQQQVLTMRYGLDGGGSRMLGEVGKALGGVTRERVRQMEGVALRQLRHPMRARALRGWLHTGEQRPRERRQVEPEQEMTARIDRAVSQEIKVRAARRAPRPVAVDPVTRALAVERARAYKGGIRFRVPRRVDVERGTV